MTEGATTDVTLRRNVWRCIFHLHTSCIIAFDDLLLVAIKRFNKLPEANNIDNENMSEKKETTKHLTETLPLFYILGLYGQLTNILEAFTMKIMSFVAVNFSGTPLLQRTFEGNSKTGIKWFRKVQLITSAHCCFASKMTEFIQFLASVNA